MRICHITYVCWCCLVQIKVLSFPLSFQESSSGTPLSWQCKSSGYQLVPVTLLYQMMAWCVFQERWMENVTGQRSLFLTFLFSSFAFKQSINQFTFLRTVSSSNQTAVFILLCVIETCSRGELKILYRCYIIIVIIAKSAIFYICIYSFILHHPKYWSFFWPITDMDMNMRSCNNTNKEASHVLDENFKYCMKIMLFVLVTHSQRCTQHMYVVLMKIIQ